MLNGYVKTELKTASKTKAQKIAEATDDLIGNRITRIQQIKLQRIQHIRLLRQF